MKKNALYYYVFAVAAILCILVVFLFKNGRELSPSQARSRPSVTSITQKSVEDFKTDSARETESPSSSPGEKSEVATSQVSGETGKGPILVISGKVSLPDGSAAKDASLEIKKLEVEEPSFREIVITTASVDPQGKYRISVPDDKYFLLSVHKKGFASATSVIPNVDLLRGLSKGSGKREITKDFVLNPASFIKGRVKDEKDSPVARVAVRAFAAREAQFQEQFNTSEVKSDDKGYFSIEDIPPGETTLGAESPDYPPIIQKVVAPAENVLIKFSSQGCSLSGHVYLKSTGEAVTSATVQIFFIAHVPFLRSLERKVVTKPDGAFSFGSLAQGRYVIRVEKSNLYLLPLKDVPNNQIELKEGEQKTGLNLFLYEGHAIQGRVTEKNSGAPLEGVKVFLVWGGNRDQNMDMTDSDGYYMVKGISQNQVGISAEKDGYILVTESEHYAFVPVPLSPDVLEAKKDLQMIQGVTISGKVQTRDGLPVTNAEIYLYQANNWTTREKSYPVDQSGNFKIPAAPFTSCRLKAEAPDLPFAFTDLISVQDKPVENVVIVMNQACSIKGIVVAPDGKPVETAKVRISLSLEFGNMGYSENVGKEPVSDQKGNFEASNLPSGKIELSAVKEGYASSKRVTLTLAPGEEKTGVTLEMNKATYLAGKITNPEGEPLEGVNIYVHAGIYETNSYGQGKSDNNGHYRIEGLIDAPHYVNLSHPEYGSDFIRDVEVGRDNADFVMGAKAKITLIGKVVDWKTQKPVENFSVTSMSDAKPEKDPNVPGRFVVKKLNPEMGYRFRIDSPDYQSLDTGYISFTKDQETVEKTFELGPGGSIAGRVIRSGTKEPLSGVGVQFYSTANQWDISQKQPEKALTTSGDGLFRFEKASAGQNYVIFSPAEPLTGKTMQITVRHGEVADLGDVEIGSGGLINGRLVQMPDEAPLPGKKITISGMGAMPQTKNTVTDAEGRFEFPGMTNARYTVSAEEYKISQFVELMGEETQECILRVGTGTLKGKVMKDGKPLRASLYLSQASLSYNRNVATDTSGAFEITGLAPGHWQVTIYAGDYNNPYQEYVDISATSVTEKIFDVKFPSGRIVGRVVNIKDEPVAGAAVSARLSRVQDADDGFSPRTFTAKSLEDGSFVIEKLEQNSYTVYASKEDLGVALVENVIVPANGDSAPVILKIGEKEGGTLVSVALNLTNGQPVPEAWCYLSTPQGTRFEHGQKRGTDGVMRIPNIPAGSYLVQVSSFGFSVHERTVEIKAGETIEIEDVMYEAGALRWTVVDSKGMPLADASCILEPVDKNSIEKVREGKTDKNGLWIQRGLYPGEYKVTSSFADGSQVSQLIQVQAHQLVQQTAVLK